MQKQISIEGICQITLDDVNNIIDIYYLNDVTPEVRADENRVIFRKGDKDAYDETKVEAQEEAEVTQVEPKKTTRRTKVKHSE